MKKGMIILKGDPDRFSAEEHGKVPEPGGLRRQTGLMDEAAMKDQATAS